MENSRYKAFVASVETGSFSKAAEKINYTPPACASWSTRWKKSWAFRF